MAKPLTRCPNCSSKITNRFECRNCGLLFDRYFKAEARKKKAEKERKARQDRTRDILKTTVSTLIILIIMSGGLFYYLKSKRQQSNQQTGLSYQSAAADSVGSEQQKRIPPTAPRQTVSQPDNALETIVKATVTIHSPWGVGTGFFIKPDKLITSRHTVEYDERRLKEETDRYNQFKVTIDDNNEKISRMKEQLVSIRDPQEKADYEAAIAVREQNREKWLARLADDESRIRTMSEQMETPDLYVILADGTKVHMAFMNVSNRYDLALLTVFNTEVAPAIIADKPLEEEAATYSVGTNRKSIHGKYTGQNPEGYLTTDAPVNRQYSGGALIDKDGKVQGVSILPDPEQKGVGRAVPMTTVLQEFGL